MQPKYCTYLTVYYGNKMPMFYIGRSNTSAINNGYRGSVASKKYKEIWQFELANNPQLFKTKILSEHTSAKDAAIKEEYLHKKFQVHKNPMYINQATAAGTFFADIRGKKNPFYGSKRTGELNPMFGKKHKKSSLEKMSSSGKGKHSQPKTENFKKQLRELYKGKTFVERYGIEKAAEIQEKIKKPKSKEHIESMRNTSYNKNRPKFECPCCKKMVSASNLKRWHGSQCKLVALRNSLTNTNLSCSDNEVK